MRVGCLHAPRRGYARPDALLASGRRCEDRVAARGRLGVTLVLRIIWGAFVVGFTGAALFAMANGEWLAFCVLGLAATGSLRQLLAYLPTDDGDDRSRPPL